MDRLYSEMYNRYYKHGKSYVEDKTSGDAIKKKRKQLREEHYYKPMVDQLKSIINSGNMTPEVYSEMWSKYQEGRKTLEDENGPRTDKAQTIMGRNAGTDTWRSLAERTLFGYKIFAADGLRAKVGGQIAGWSGVGGTTSGSNAANGEAPSYPYEDTALDFYFDPIRRLALSSPENQAKADAIHKYTQFMGNAFVTGKIGSQEWQTYLSDTSDLMSEMTPEEWRGEKDQERADEYLSTINRTLNKLHKTEGGLDEDKMGPQRNYKELFGKGHDQKALAINAVDIIRAMMNPQSANVVDYYDRGNLFESVDTDENRMKNLIENLESRAREDEDGGGTKTLRQFLGR